MNEPPIINLDAPGGPLKERCESCRNRGPADPSEFCPGSGWPPPFRLDEGLVLDADCPRCKRRILVCTAGGRPHFGEHFPPRKD